ncbi:DUF2273 domain-containing protein [Paenibacillus xerothermodurans]|uniref:DUF2273 domain-containing protein n=1 Tax=Paenibacillus xerothermodurans TaxID=1977292 RepID=A0A2W1NG51_PAEXE|nr:DUF2273 domain-containing protein [Paenibacillus xerothermodurans]PZE22051.1 DUF2273 domain-containing protein [Paenibacillus xerothermodurans]
MWRQIWEHLWTGHRGKTIGAAAGVLLGLIYLLCGLWHMLIFALIVYTGYYIGKRIDRGQTPIPVEDMLRWLMDKWRLR